MIARSGQIHEAYSYTVSNFQVALADRAMTKKSRGLALRLIYFALNVKNLRLPEALVVFREINDHVPTMLLAS
jgi:hypothetical protein